MSTASHLCLAFPAFEKLRQHLANAHADAIQSKYHATAIGPEALAALDDAIKSLDLCRPCLGHAARLLSEGK
jgi:hypothetical protein